MKIAVWHNLPSGGGKRVLYQHVKGLLERGHTVECWCPPSADRAYLPLGDLATEHVRPVDWPTFPRRPLSATVASARTLLAQLSAMDRHGRQCAEEIVGGGFDLVYANPCMYFRVPAIARHTSLPTVLYLQEPNRSLYEALPELPWISSASRPRPRLSPKSLLAPAMDYVRLRGLRAQAREELRNARACATILANSQFSRESILRAYGLEAKVCYLGIDTTLFVDRERPREPFTVGIGSFTPVKRIDFVIRALAHVPRMQRRLVWIGNIEDAAYLEKLKALAASLDVTFDPRIRVSDAEIVEILNRAMVMAYAPRLEPFGLAPLEANACGVPVVAVGEGGVRETVLHGHNGLLCESEPAAMASDIASLLDDPARARRLGEQARRLVGERWSLKAAIDRVEERLIEVIDTPRKPVDDAVESMR